MEMMGIALAKLKGSNNCPDGTLGHTYTPMEGSTITTAEVYCIIDTLGEPYSSGNNEPDSLGGGAWDVAGMTNATRMTIRRKSTVLSPNIDWDESRGTNTDNSEWNVVSSNNVGNAGMLTNGLGVQLLNAPNIIAPAQSTSTAITIEWVSILRATYYEVHRSDSSSGPYEKIDPPDSSIITTSYTDSGLSASTAYYYKVNACNDARCSFSASELATMTAPVVPTNLRSGTIDPNEIPLEWGLLMGLLIMKCIEVIALVVLIPR